MSNIRKAFENGKAFIAFITCGDPDLETTGAAVRAAAAGGADLIELGIPFSDPTAEGVVIQEASLRALKGGMTTDKAFEIVRKVRESSDVPLVFMTYINPVFHYGYDRFFQKCQELDVSGIILPDLPFEEKEEVEPIAEKYGVSVISMISPTSDERIQKIASGAKGFLYVVSSMGVTGMRNEICTDLEGMIREIRAVTDTPVAVGFGIHTPEQAREIAAMADGVIVGSAIVRLIAQYKEHAGKDIFSYVRMMSAAVNGTQKN